MLYKMLMAHIIMKNSFSRFPLNDAQRFYNSLRETFLQHFNSLVCVDSEKRVKSKALKTFFRVYFIIKVDADYRECDTIGFETMHATYEELIRV